MSGQPIYVDQYGNRIQNIYPNGQNPQAQVYYAQQQPVYGQGVGQQRYMPVQQSEADMQRARLEYLRMQRRQEQMQRERIQYFEIMWSGVCVFIMFFSIAIYHGEANCGNYKTWLKVSLGLYLTDLIVAMNQLMSVKKLRHESLWLLVVMFVLLLTNTCWFIYGNVLYYRNRDFCGAQDNPGASPELTSAMWIMVLIGYTTMCKCCCISALLAYLVPLLITIYRRQNNQGIPGLLKKLKKGKIKLDDLQSEDSNKQCSICFEDYVENDEVVTLPCDVRHMFHTSCITEWLKQKDTCPLCKTPVTKESLQQQRSGQPDQPAAELAENP